MKAERVATVIETHLDDLQSEIEASARFIDYLKERAIALYEADALLTRKIRELRDSVLQQRATLRDLRRELRGSRLRQPS